MHQDGCDWLWTVLIVAIIWCISTCLLRLIFFYCTVDEDGASKGPSLSPIRRTEKVVDYILKHKENVNDIMVLMKVSENGSIDELHASIGQPELFNLVSVHPRLGPLQNLSRSITALHICDIYICYICYMSIYYMIEHDVSAQIERAFIK